MAGSRKLSDEEIKNVLVFLASGRNSLRNQAFFLLGTRTGFRVSELVSLKVGDVYRDGSILPRVLVASKNMKGKKRARSTPIHPEAASALKLWIEKLGNDPELFLFQSRQGQNRPITRVQAWNILVEAYRSLGLLGKLGTHALRKTFAQRVHKTMGNDVFKTQKALGHARLDSTAKYLSVDQEEIDEAILKS